MAVINSNAVGKAVKSAGVNTYRTVRGRCIMSQRIISNKSKTDNQVKQRGAFGIVAGIVKFMSPFIDRAFPNTKYGTSRNNFVRTNKNLMMYQKTLTRLPDYELTPLEYFACELDRSKSYGGAVYCSSGGNPINYESTGFRESGTLRVQSSRKIKAGDIVLYMLGCTFENKSSKGVRTDLLNILEYVVKEEDIQTMENPFVLELTSSEIPELSNPFSLLPPNSAFFTTVEALALIGANDYSQSTFKHTTALPPAGVVMKTTVGDDSKTITFEVSNPLVFDEDDYEKMVGKVFKGISDEFTIKEVLEDSEEVLTIVTECNHSVLSPLGEYAACDVVYMTSSSWFTIGGIPDFVHID